MKIGRLDLDGISSPAGLVTRILALEPNLPIPVPIEQLCERLDIVSIAELHTEGFEAALITDGAKASGAILVRAGIALSRRRFSIGHELGHFLIPAHLPPPGGKFLCSTSDLLALSKREQDQHARREAEANQFAALLLIPPPILGSELRGRTLDLAEIGRLAKAFDVSREAMARACIDHSPSAIAVLVVQHGRILRMYRSKARFPFIEPGRGQLVPQDSVFHHRALPAGMMTSMDICTPEVWLGPRSDQAIHTLEEQVLFQREGFAMILLRAELRARR